MTDDNISLWLASHACQPFNWSYDKNTEAIDNLFRLTIHDLLPDLPTAEELDKALIRFLDIRKDVLSSQRDLLPITLYMWHDEPTGSICISALSRIHKSQLPFSCRIVHVYEVMPIVTSFLSSATLEGIPWDDLTMDECSNCDHPDFSLEVFVTTIT